MKFYTHMYLDNLYNPIEFQGHRSKIKVTQVFFCFSVCMMLRLPATVLSLEQGLMILFSLILVLAYTWAPPYVDLQL